jgi:hypothetical protein
MAVALVNSKVCKNITTCTTGWNVTSGNAMFVFLGNGSGSSPPTLGVTDGTNSYSVVGSVDQYGAHIYIYGTILSAGGTTLTVTTAGTWNSIVIAEFSGVT